MSLRRSILRAAGRLLSSAGDRIAHAAFSRVPDGPGAAWVEAAMFEGLSVWAVGQALLEAGGGGRRPISGGPARGTRGGVVLEFRGVGGGGSKGGRRGYGRLN